MTKNNRSTIALISILALFLFRYYMGPDDPIGPLITVEFVCWLLSISIVCIFLAKQELLDFYHGKLTPKKDAKGLSRKFKPCRLEYRKGFTTHCQLVFYNFYQVYHRQLPLLQNKQKS